MKKLSEYFTCLRLFTFLSAFAVFFGFAVSSQSKELKVTVLTAKPYGSVGEDGVIKGLIVDWISAISNEAGLDFKVRLATIARIKPELKFGNTDVTVLLLSKSMLEVADCIEIVSSSRVVVVGRKDTRISSLQDLYDITKPVGSIRGAKYGKLFDDDDKIKKYDTETYQQNVEMLFKKRLDAIIGIENALFKAAKDMGYDRAAFGEPVEVSKKDLCLYFSKSTDGNWEIEKQALAKATAKLRKNGRLREIEQKWTK